MPWRNQFELMEMFSIKITNQGALDFGELCARLAVDAHVLGKMPVRDNVKIMCRMRGIPRQFLYQRMKQDMRPMLEADDATLAALGLVPPGSKTATALAKSVARWMLDT